MRDSRSHEVDHTTSDDGSGGAGSPTSRRRVITRRRSLAAGVIGVLALSGCAAGAPETMPTATAPPAPTAPPTATPVPPTATALPATPTSTPAPEPTLPAATEAPEDDAATTGTTAGAYPMPPALQAEVDETGMAALAYYGTSGRREVALTFDAGADRGNAEGILDLLLAEGIPASFGMMGQWAEANPDLVLRMVAEGHQLFNHSWTHASLSGATTATDPLTREQLEQELVLTEDAVAKITDAPMRPYFRPPYGDYDEATLRVLVESGYLVALLWSRDTRDSIGATGEEILRNAVDDAQPGRIILMHVGGQSEAFSVLPQIIASLRDQGFSFATANAILQP